MTGVELGRTGDILNYWGIVAGPVPLIMWFWPLERALGA